MTPENQHKMDALFRRIIADMRRKPTLKEKLKPLIPMIIVLILCAFLWWILTYAPQPEGALTQ